MAFGQNRLRFFLAGRSGASEASGRSGKDRRGAKRVPVAGTDFRMSMPDSMQREPLSAQLKTLESRLRVLIQDDLQPIDLVQPEPKGGDPH